MSAAAPPAGAPSRAAKIWHRTRVGTGLSAAVGLLLWGATQPSGHYLVLGCGVLAALGVAVEAWRLGLLGPGRGEGAGGLACWVLAVAGAALWLLLVADPTRSAPILALEGLSTHWLAVGGAACAVLAVGALGLALGVVERAHPAARLGALLWIAMPLPALYLVVVELGVAGLGALILLSKVGDVAGYYFGNLLGTRFPHHPFPRLSPGKTSVGCLGSFLFGTLSGLLVLWAGWLPEPRFGVASALIAAALVNLASQAGDLLESRAKRRAGVKDSGTLFGPSGGFLDLVDSLLLSVPTALLTWPLFFEGPWSP